MNCKAIAKTVSIDQPVSHTHTLQTECDGRIKMKRFLPGQHDMSKDFRAERAAL